MIKVIDYGLGNIQAFLNAFSLLGLQAARAKVPADIAGATHLVLPGVGSFDLAMQLFVDSGMREVVEEYEGSFDGGQYSGEGKLTKNGEVYEGLFIENKFVE